MRPLQNSTEREKNQNLEAPMSRLEWLIFVLAILAIILGWVLVWFR